MTYLLAVSHPDDLWTLQYVIRVTYHAIICHPDDLVEVCIHPDELPHTLPFLSHPDEIANFDFLQHAVALHISASVKPYKFGTKKV